MKTASAASSAKVPFTSKEWAAVWGLIVLCILNIVFWAVYEQQGNTMQLWADEQTNWPTIFGWTIPSTWFQSFNPFMIFCFTPLLNLLWARQAATGKEPSSVTKMAIGCCLVGLSFLVMVTGAYMLGTGKGSMLWPFACTAIITLGELYLSPIGLSLVTKVAPARIVSMMMGMWFMSNFVGNYLSGFIGSFYSRMPKTSFFFLLTLLGVGAGIAIWLLNKPLKKAIGANV
jgi:POT family proton-dependent oligopeptide transporter